MIQFITKPEPMLTIYGKNYKGISMLEALELILNDPTQHQNLPLTEVSRYFDMIANYHRQSVIPSLGFHLHDVNAVLPTKRIIDVGFDLTIISVAKKISNKITLYETGVALDIPIGYYVELVPRSSMSKTGYMLANSVGVIDPGFTGTVKVPLIKVDDSMPNIELPIRIAQLILKPYVFAYARQVNYISQTTRGSGGFGSTNIKSYPIDIPNRTIKFGGDYICNRGDHME
jgi:deoxyuridine 5'-triphosphate nucleotidohydrolase